MVKRFFASSVCAISVCSMAACSQTGTPLTPTPPSLDANAANADGTLVKATAPTPMAPVSDARVTSLTPQLRIANAAGVYDPSVRLTYQFQLMEGSTLVAEPAGIAPGSGQTTWSVPANVLKLNTTYVWRARAAYNGAPGPWSSTATFSTPIPVPTTSGGPVACGGSSGPEIVACVVAAYPDRLVITNLAKRTENMLFLRDRIIETGTCKGFNLGQNYKRGTAVVSEDFIVLRTSVDRGVDIATGWDDVSSPLKLKWQVFDTAPYGHPFYKPYGTVDCSGVN